MADKTYKLNISKTDGSFNDSVQFTIPKREGTYKIEFELSNGNKVNAGNINVSTVEKTYKAEFQLSNGNTIDGGTFTTPIAQGWHTVLEGSENVVVSMLKTGTFADGSGMYSGEGKKQYSITSNTYRTRITYIVGSGLPQTTELTTSYITLTAGSNSSVSTHINSSSNNIDFITVIKSNKPNTKVFYFGEAVTLTKIEQYY